MGQMFLACAVLMFLAGRASLLGMHRGLRAEARTPLIGSDNRMTCKYLTHKLALEKVILDICTPNSATSYCDNRFFQMIITKKDSLG
jgi:hypothetical protein